MSVGNGAILNFPVTLSSTMNTGVYSFIYSNVVISNTSNQNVSSTILEDGKISVAENLSNATFWLLNAVKVYPNPTNDNITVAIPDMAVLEKIEVYNSLGQFIASRTNNIVSLGNLATGDYYLKIFTTEGTVTKKLIKL
jgi:hypothetical protein